MKGGFPYRVQMQQIYEWRNNHTQVLKQIQTVQNHTSRQRQQPGKNLAQVWEKI